MVKVREEYSFNGDGSVNFSHWLARLEAYRRLDNHEMLRAACDVSWQVEQQAVAAENTWSPGISSYRTGLEMAEILAQLRLDSDAIIASILYRPVREGSLPLEAVRQEFGDTVARLVQGVLRMAAINETNTSKTRVLGQSHDQVENVRKMLLALVDDVRVALIKIAERTCAIRAVKKAGEEKRRRVAREVFDIYAPLAHRLGIGQLKWELEDLAFRYLEENSYKRIASLLDERRIDRERFITQVTELLREHLMRARVDAEVNGRVKSIYSIWRKMQRKDLDFAQIFDVRAVRILVPDVRDCYATLGIVHNLWRVVPNEFDDYIANPKPNGYQSLHTAVIGPDSRVFEIQIRTFAMDEDAELGVCAHWRYKEGVQDPGNHDSYGEKVEWLRQVLAWHDEMGMMGGLADQLRSDSAEAARIYVFTPEGHVVDMMQGATPLDFAYYVHTEVGHHCSGARVNGRSVPLNYQLCTGDRVEVMSSDTNQPSREWLKPHLGFVNTPRARAKMVQWFRTQSSEENRRYGQQILEYECERLGVSGLDMGAIARKLGCRNEDGFYMSVGVGSIRIDDVLDSAESLDMLVWEDEPAPAQGKLIEMDWPETPATAGLPVTLHVTARDRAGLLRDVSTILAEEQLTVEEMGTHTDASSGTATMELSMTMPSYHTLSRVLDRISHLDHVIQANRANTTLHRSTTGTYDDRVVSIQRAGQRTR
ncbi:MAG: HD domain-containing protein [Pseudohongiellaceae bacterium]